MNAFGQGNRATREGCNHVRQKIGAREKYSSHFNRQGTCRASPSMFLSKWLAPFEADLCVAVRGGPKPDRLLLATVSYHQAAPVCDRVWTHGKMPCHVGQPPAMGETSLRRALRPAGCPCHVARSATGDLKPATDPLAGARGYQRRATHPFAGARGHQRRATHPFAGALGTGSRSDDTRQLKDQPADDLRDAVDELGPVAMMSDTRSRFQPCPSTGWCSPRPRRTRDQPSDSLDRLLMKQTGFDL